MPFAVTIHEKGGQPRRQEFDKTEVTIGRVQGNDIILPKQNVSYSGNSLNVTLVPMAEAETTER